MSAQIDATSLFKITGQQWKAEENADGTTYALEADEKIIQATKEKLDASGIKCSSSDLGSRVVSDANSVTHKLTVTISKEAVKVTKPAEGGLLARRVKVFDWITYLQKKDRSKIPEVHNKLREKLQKDSLKEAKVDKIIMYASGLELYVIFQYEHQNVFSYENVSLETIEEVMNSTTTK